MSSSESLPKPRFYAEQVVCGRWKVLREIGRGGCGAESVDPEGRYAQTIRMEAHVLSRLQHSEHFCRLFLVCRMDPNTNVLIMSLVGRSLSWLRRQTARQQFTLSTAIRASLQCLNKFYSNYVLEKCPPELWRVMNHLETLKWNSRPDYELIRRALEDVCAKNRFGVTEPFDWEHGGAFYARIRAADIKSRQERRA
ncbi:hypothetical protein M3Y99_01261200 [Aphelenchoides fujianensis]|nr:hypothetical protein M3Y99_01261200 [Aphelenchoides fujianensis]